MEPWQAFAIYALTVGLAAFLLGVFQYEQKDGDDPSAALLALFWPFVLAILMFVGILFVLPTKIHSFAKRIAE